MRPAKSGEGDPARDEPRGGNSGSEFAKPGAVNGKPKHEEDLAGDEDPKKETPKTNSESRLSLLSRLGCERGVPGHMELRASNEAPREAELSARRGASRYDGLRIKVGKPSKVQPATSREETGSERAKPDRGGGGSSWPSLRGDGVGPKCKRSKADGMKPK